ncbi:hypothetical protein B0H14DRAFT_2628988 [Mycena olivaceomarginata]|nr:hypothetical protein B0H14DRAFT_2628988 [Mycena olivaceomarginata]
MSSVSKNQEKMYLASKNAEYSVDLRKHQVKASPGLVYLNGGGTRQMSPKKQVERCIDESDPESYRRYKKWQSSRDYNARNRKARNAKKRENMATLRAKQQLDSPTVKAARLAAKEKSAREYRERNRGILAARAAHARALARWGREADKCEAIWLAVRQDRALSDLEAAEFDHE